jgi:hypothetical protein
MAKVKIQGHASGTGVLTVTAPNTSTDRTITLPDSTGTLATTADSVGGANGVDFNDNVKARFGTGNDFAIWHDGSHTRFQNDTGNLNVRADVFNVTKSDDSENIILAEADGDVKLYRNNVIHLETLATGVRIPVGGVLFGTDTAANNALDDYEEGTWNPANQYITLTNNHTARYVKIGNLVTVWGNVTWASSPSDVSQTGGLIQGLPFTPVAGGFPWLPSHWVNTSTGARKDDSEYDYYLDNSTTMTIYSRPNSRVVQRQQVSGTQMKFTATYTTG